VSRLLLLRWRRAYIIAMVLAPLTMLAVTLGMWFWCSQYGGSGQPEYRWSWTTRHVILEITFFSVAVGVLVAWPAWGALVRLFLPPRTANLLLDWQRAISEPTQLAR